jgi:protein-disulfide isomerase
VTKRLGQARLGRAHSRTRSLSWIGAALIAAVSATAARSQTAEITAAGEAAILSAPATPFAGNPRGSVTIVEYFDVNCPQCRALAPRLAELIATDRNVRLLYKDWPIFGGISVEAAKAELAATWQGRYLPTHEALITAPTRLASVADLRARLKAVGVDLGRLDKDLVDHEQSIVAILKRNEAEAAKLSFQGTPGLVVGRYIVPGGLSLENLRILVKASETAADDRKS